MRKNLVQAALAIAAAAMLSGCSTAGATNQTPATPAPAATTPTPAAATATSAAASTSAATTSPSAGTVVTETFLPSFRLSSPSFTGGEIPAKYTCNGDDTSPALHWEGAPEATKSFVLIVEDPDAANFVHWVAYNIEGGPTGNLAAGITEAGPPAQAMSSFGKNAYGGPCPPSGTHHYTFSLYALASTLTVDHPSTATADDIRAEMKGHVLAETELTATYTAAA